MHKKTICGGCQIKYTVFRTKKTKNKCAPVILCELTNGGRGRKNQLTNGKSPTELSITIERTRFLPPISRWFLLSQFGCCPHHPKMLLFIC